MRAEINRFGRVTSFVSLRDSDRGKGDVCTVDTISFHPGPSLLPSSVLFVICSSERLNCPWRFFPERGTMQANPDCESDLRYRFVHGLTDFPTPKHYFKIITIIIFFYFIHFLSAHYALVLDEGKTLCIFDLVPDGQPQLASAQRDFFRADLFRSEVDLSVVSTNSDFFSAE